MAKPPVPNTKPWATLFPPDYCSVCFDPPHPTETCQQDDEAWRDPVLGGDPSNPPRICGCTEYRALVRDAFAPFTPEQVERLRKRQAHPDLHPYTCAAHGGRGVLEPGMDGMVCPVPGCGYRQTWVHAVDVSPEAFWLDPEYGLLAGIDEAR